MPNHRRLICILIAISELMMLASPVYSSPCYIPSVDLSYPQVVAAQQHFVVSATVTAICNAPADPFVDIRVDVVDAHAALQPAVISSNRQSYSLLQIQSPVATILNDVIAPRDIGTWVLQIDAYVIGVPSGTVLFPYHKTFNVEVVPYTPTSTISTITTTTSLTTTPITSTTSQQVALPTSIVTSTSTLRESPRQEYSSYYAAIFILLIAIIIVVLRSKKRSMKEKTRVWDANPQGPSAA